MISSNESIKPMIHCFCFSNVTIEDVSRGLSVELTTMTVTEIMLHNGSVQFVELLTALVCSGFVYLTELSNSV